MDVVYFHFLHIILFVSGCETLMLVFPITPKCNIRPCEQSGLCKNEEPASQRNEKADVFYSLIGPREQKKATGREDKDRDWDLFLFPC